MGLWNILVIWDFYFLNDDFYDFRSNFYLLNSNFYDFRIANQVNYLCLDFFWTCVTCKRGIHRNLNETLIYETLDETSRALILTKRIQNNTIIRFLSHLHARRLAQNPQQQTDWSTARRHHPHSHFPPTIFAEIITPHGRRAVCNTKTFILLYNSASWGNLVYA